MGRLGVVEETMGLGRREDCLWEGWRVVKVLVGLRRLKLWYTFREVSGL